MHPINSGKMPIPHLNVTAKAGAYIGAGIGTAIFPGAGTLIGGALGGLVLGIAGSIGGSALGEWIVDISDIRE